MPPLKNVSCSLLTEEIVNKLQHVAITSVTRFLSREVADISSETRIPYKDLSEIRQALIAQFSPPNVAASDLYYELLTKGALFSTGCAKLDTLCEGIFTSEITELVGTSASGKTQLCFSLSATVCLETQRSVLYVDTNGSFSAKRLLELARAKADNEQCLLAMKKIQLIQVNDLHKLIEILNQFDTYAPDLGLIILDSIFSLISPHFDGIQPEGPGNMTLLAQLLNRVAFQRHLAVVWCNSMVGGDNFELRPALGRYWHHVPSVRLQLSVVQAGTVTVGEQRIVTLLKSPRLRAGSSVMLHLTATGFH